MTRLAAGALAVIAWAAIALQFVLTVGGIVANGGTVLEGVWRFFAYFTILTNILVAGVLTGFALGRPPGARLATMAAMSILAVCVIYHFLLSGTWDPQGWQKVADVVMHYVTPLLFVIFWLFGVPKRSLAWGDAPVMLVWPAGYLVWMLARGALDRFYPYYFIDPTQTGWPAFAVNAAAICLAFGVLSLAFIAIDRRTGARRATAA